MRAGVVFAVHLGLGLAQGLAVPAVAAAQTADGLYGRFDGDLVLTAGVSAGPAFDDGPAGALAEIDLRARYLDAAGLVVAPGWITDPGAGRLFVGLEIRPFFPSRFLLDLWTGHRWFDLMIDSIGLELGAVFGPWWTADTSAGVAFAWGGGLELPLVMGPDLAHGVHLRLGFRRVRSRAGDQAGPEGPRTSDWTVLGGLVIRGLVDLGTQAPR